MNTRRLERFCRPFLFWLVPLLGVPATLPAQSITALNIEGVTQFYDQPYLLDFNLALRDQIERAILTDPTNVAVVCKEDGTPISASETGFRLLAAANKPLKCFLVLDYTLSMADPAINGDQLPSAVAIFLLNRFSRGHHQVILIQIQ